MGDAAGDSYSSIEGLIGSAFSDLLLGNNHANTLKGLGGDDFLFGLDGDDVLVGGAGGDYHDGGSGFDVASYEGGVVGVVASLSAPGRNRGDAAGDSYWSIEGLVGTGLNDQLTGDIGANALHGGAGNDVLSGLFGNDRLDGGDGDDVMAGGWGSDTFEFGQGFGRDTISDWQDGSLLGNDVISFKGLGLSLADLTVSFDVAGATIHVVGTDDEIFLAGVRRGTLTAEDFMF